MGFAEPLGVIINMKDQHSAEDAHYEQWLRQNAEHKCFHQPILRVSPLQAATRFAPRPRSYWAKYPGQTGASLRELTTELLDRLAAPDAPHKRETALGRAARG
jgi:chromosome partitioning protein